MRKARIILALAVVALFVSACWQIASCVLANVELQMICETCPPSWGRESA